MSLTEKYLKEQEEKNRKEKAQADAQMKMAVMYDAVAKEKGLSVEPRITNFPLYGSLGVYGFRELTAKQILTLIEAFPPSRAGIWRTPSCVGFRPFTALPENWSTLGNGYQWTDTHGVYLKMSKTARQYPTENEFDWYSEVGGTLVHLSAKLKEDNGITPTIDADVNSKMIFGQEVIKIQNCRTNLMGYSHAPLCEIRYAKGGDDHYNDFLVYSVVEQKVGVLGLLEFIGGKQKQKQERLLASYEHDKKHGVELPKRDRVEGPYETRTLRAGTKAQTEALETMAARSDQALASKHWEFYCQDNGIDLGKEKRYSHLTWAQHYLERFGLEPDPNGPGGKQYWYGRSWL